MSRRKPFLHPEARGFAFDPTGLRSDWKTRPMVSRLIMAVALPIVPLAHIYKALMESFSMRDMVSEFVICFKGAFLPWKTGGKP